MKSSASAAKATAMRPMITYAACHPDAPRVTLTMKGMVMPPKLIPVTVMPMILPWDDGNQMAIRRPAGRAVMPEMPMNCRKLRPYQCQSSVMAGRTRKLMPMRRSEMTSTGRAPCRSMSRPTMGEARLPTAVNDREAEMAVRDQPKASSRGSTKRPKA